MIGAGLSGVTVAVFLTQAGVRVLVCEQADQVGGLFNCSGAAATCFDGGIKAAENSAVMLTGKVAAEHGLKNVKDGMKSCDWSTIPFYATHTMLRWWGLAWAG